MSVFATRTLDAHRALTVNADAVCHLRLEPDGRLAGVGLDVAVALLDPRDGRELLTYAEAAAERLAELVRTTAAGVSEDPAPDSADDPDDANERLAEQQRLIGAADLVTRTAVELAELRARIRAAREILDRTEPAGTSR